MTGFGLTMGLATLVDFTGIDINYQVGKTFAHCLGSRYHMHPLTEAIYTLGEYGRKTGRGYYDYSGDKLMPNPRVAAVVAGYIKDHGVSPRPAQPGEIVELMLACGINEAALMMEEGIGDRPADMDLAMITGTGFPPYRSSLLRYADQWGLTNVYAKLQELHARYGERFATAGLIKKMAEEGKTFYEDC